MKAQYQLTDKVRPNIFITCKNEDERQLLDQEKTWIIQAGYSGEVKVQMQSGEGIEGCIQVPIGPTVQCHMYLKGHIKPDEEKKKLEKKRGILQKSLDGLKKKMALPTYEDKVPANVRKENAE